MSEEYYEDLQKRESDGKIFEHEPYESEGDDNAETWRHIPNKGLYHFKKFGGQWYSRLFTPDVKLFQKR